MSVTRRTLASGNVSWRAKVFWAQRVVAQQSFERRTDAKRWEADQLAKLASGGWIDPARGRVTFAALAEEWQASRQHLAVRSQETTRFLLDSYVLPVIGRPPIGAISATDVERVLTAMMSRGLAYRPLQGAWRLPWVVARGLGNRPVICRKPSSVAHPLTSQLMYAGEYT